MLGNLKTAKRALIEAELSPLQGDRFQPTGFADLGAAIYQAPDRTSMLLVESSQSIANRLETTILDSDNELTPELKGLPYIQVDMQGVSTSRTNSLIEAHRINSPFIISDKGFQERFKAESDYAKGKPINWQKVAKALFKYDINSLLHGVFLANLEDGRIKFARALSGFIEAKGVKEVVSGGVKNNLIDPTGKLRAKEYNRDVYSNVPYQRIEYTAEAITAFFNIDLSLLRSYALGEDAWELLTALGLLKIRRFLDRGLRLRTACDLKLKDGLKVTEPDSFQIPEELILLTFIQEKIKSSSLLFADPPVTKIITEVMFTTAGKADEDADVSSSSQEEE